MVFLSMQHLYCIFIDKMKQKHKRKGSETSSEIGVKTFFGSTQAFQPTGQLLILLRMNRSRIKEVYRAKRHVHLHRKRQSSIYSISAFKKCHRIFTLGLANLSRYIVMWEFDEVHVHTIS